MVKRNKKNIKDIQAALLSNTEFLNKEEEPAELDEIQESIIDEEVLKKFEALAEFENTQAKELINKALSHYLKLKGLQLEQALKAKKQQP